MRNRIWCLVTAQGGLIKHQKSHYIHEFIETYKRSVAVSRMIEPIRRAR